MPTPKFGLAKSAAEARKIAEDIGTNDLVVKAQVNLALFDLSLTFAFSRFLLVSNFARSCIMIAMAMQFAMVPSTPWNQNSSYRSDFERLGC